jgi:beta-lactamase regulating signal transducer with metallopeptidase domain
VIASAASILFEAALRTLIAACTLWAGLRLLRVKNVRAQKAAWSVLLLAGFAMPLLVIGVGQGFPALAEIRLPAFLAPSIGSQAPANQTSSNPAPPNSALSNFVQTGAAPVEESATAPEPNALVTETSGRHHASDARFETVPDAPAQKKLIASPPVAARVQTEPIQTQPAQAQPIQTRPIQAGPTRTAPQKTARTPLNLLGIAWLVYLAVAGALLLRFFIGLASSIRLWLQAKPVDAARECGMPGGLATRSSNRISSPANIGSGIILPADYSEWDTEKLRAVLAHERSHVNQRDFYLQLLAGFYAAITWFSPLGWWLKRKLSELSEAISDRAGLEESASSSAYAQLLLEFAALPRPTFTGVAMAHSTNLSHRIERLLNESTFKQAFIGSRRALVTALIVPALLVGLTSVVRVQAAQAPLSAAPALPATQAPVVVLAQSPSTGQANAAPVAEAAPVQNPDQAPASPQPAPAPSPAAAPSPDAAPAAAAAPAPPLPPTESQDSIQVVVPPIPPIDVQVHIPPMPPMPPMRGFEGHAFCFTDGDSYAIVGDPGTKTRFCGNTGGEMEAEVEKARAVAHGHFLLFRHDGKFYVVDDPATVSQIEDMNKAMQDQGDKMRALGEQFRDAGRDVREQARMERETAANIPAPDLSKEMAELNAAVANLTAKQGATVPREELQQVQREVSAIQRRLIESEVKVDVKIDMSKFNAESAKFNEQMSRMGSEMGRIAQENHGKIGAIIDQSLKNGTAKPVN